MSKSSLAFQIHSAIESVNRTLPSKRDCIVLDKSSGLPKEVTSKLDEFGWKLIDIECAMSPEFDKDNPCVGLAVLESASLKSEDLAILEQLCSRANSKWIAILPSDLPANDRLWKVVGELFYDYHVLPADLQRLTHSMGHAYGMAKLGMMLAKKQQQNVAGDCILGTSEVVARLKTNISKVAPVDAPVLIEGESGSGKELTARAIHRASRRRDRPFIAVNCGAIPDGLIQSELFGHEKGSFTGAHTRRIGHFEAANGGTIFLDEIGDLPLELQVVLLRVLEEGSIRRVGGSTSIPVNVRIISATNRNLQEAIDEDSFREDLFFRLNVLNVRVPALRERLDDIPLLSRHIIENFVHKTAGSRTKPLSESALNLMYQYDWPGNVRELTNRLQQAVVMSESASITPKDLGLERRLSKRLSAETLENARDRAEKEALMSALTRHPIISHAAQSLGISRVTIYRLLKKYGLGGYQGEDNELEAG